MNKTRFLPALGLFSLLLFSTAHADTKIDPAQAAALYQQAFDSLKFDLSEQEQKILHGEQSGKMSDETRARIREGLQTLSRAASAETVDWPVKYHSLYGELFPFFENLGPARNTARMAIWYAKEIGNQNPDEALNVIRDVLSLSLHINEDEMLVRSLLSIAIDGITVAAVQDLAGHWGKPQRDRLLEILQSHNPDHSVRKTVARERSHVSSKMRAALFSIPETASLSERLRISSVMILPDETWIGLEHLHLGLNFPLEPGQTRHGIELVTFNSKEDFAIVRSEGEEAIIHLKDRKIAPIYPKNLFRLIGLKTHENVAQQLKDDASIYLTAFPLKGPLTGNESDAEIALMILNEMESRYAQLDELLANPFGDLATDRDPDADPETLIPDSLFVVQMAPSLFSMRRDEQAAQTNREMAITALRLLDNPDTPIPLDPFSPDGAPLQVTIENNTIELRSLHHRGNNRPHTFRLQTK